MTWTAPRTWSDGEIPTAAMYNAHIRDNMLVLKTTRSTAGRLSALSSTTLADLTGENITGLARLASGNDFTGTSRFTGTARVVLPVGADKFEDLGGGLRRGFWVEGDYLHHIGSNQTTEWRYLGTHVSTPSGALPGSVWVEGEYIHYIDASGLERRCASTTSGHSDAAAIPGACWVETYVHWIREAGSLELPGHADIAHSDGTVHNDTHSDVSHGDSYSDVGHSDSHSDVGHSDSHSDVAHDDSHSDVAHDDSHSDTHNDTHGDHNDGIMEYQDSHGDTAHDDAHADVAHEDTHSDVEHNDSHSDAHTDTHNDVEHADSHSDAHTDSYSDHSDHGDVVAQSQPVVVP